MTVYIDKALSPAARSALLAAAARRAVADLVAAGRASKDYETFVDGRKGAAEESVRGTGGGVILYHFNYIGAAVQYAVLFLRARSPAPSGGTKHAPYRDSFFVSVNGKMIPWAKVEPASIPADAEVFIGNMQPYNRLIDVQLAGSKPEKYSVPAGIYDDAARAVKRQFRGTVAAKRLYNISFPGQYVLRGRGRTKRIAGRVQSPALQLSMVG